MSPNIEGQSNVTVLDAHRTKRLYHVDGAGFHDGVDLPSHLSMENQEEVGKYIETAALTGAIFLGSTVPIFEKKTPLFSHYMTAVLVYTQARGGREGWNIVYNRRKKKEYEVKRLTASDFAPEIFTGDQGELLFFVATEPPLEAAIDVTLSKGKLLRLLKNSFEYLHSITPPMIG